MSKKERTQKINELTSKLSILKEQKTKVEAEAKEFAEKRKRLNEEFKGLRAEILELRKSRDQMNMGVKELKQQIEAIKTERAQKIGELKKLRQQIGELMKKKPSKSFETLQKEVESLEWKIQTSSLNLQEEKVLVEKVKNLETQLSIHRKIEQLNQKKLELEAETKALQTRARIYREKIAEKVEKSQEFHKKMLEKIEEAKKIKAEADSLHQLFLQVKEKMKPLQSEIATIIGEIRRIKEENMAEEEKNKKEKEETLLDNIEKQAKEKLKRGEKLTWEEFKVLAEKGIA